MQQTTKAPFTVTIDAYTIDGWWWDDARCSICHAEIIYASEYDATFYPRCNEWMGRQCSQECIHWCDRRPERPLPSGVFYVDDLGFYISETL